MATRKSGVLRIYKSYNFREKDPVIDKLRTATDGHKHSKIEQDSGVSSTTLRNWFHGTTKRPQFATVQAVAHAVGMTFEMRKKR